MIVSAVAVLSVEEVAIEVATEVDEDVEDSPLTEARILKVIKHLAVVRILEAEDEADFNELISLNFSAITVINLAISVMSVDHRKWKKEVILQQQKKIKMWAMLCSSLTKETRKLRKMFGILTPVQAVT